MSFRAIISCIYLGFLSQIVQVILLRETLTTFAGVEIVLGLALGVWLIGVGAGSILANRVGALQAHPLAALRALYLISSALLPLTLAVIRLLPAIIGFAPGEIVAPEIALGGSALALAPLCLTLGALFVANVRLSTADQPGWSGKVYLLEAAGAAVGGLAVTFLLIPALPHSTIVIFMVVVGLLMAAGLSARAQSRLLYAAIAVVVLSAAVTTPIATRVDAWTRSVLHPVGEILAVDDSPYGQLVITRYGEQYSLLINGTLAASFPDQATAEEAVHFALLSHPQPKTALLIGGGTGGAVREMLKHRVQLDYVELDPAVIHLARRHFPRDAAAPLDSCRMIHEDGRAYLSRTSKSYDVIILNLGEPSSMLVNRFFTHEFFAIVRARLSAEGVFSFRVPSSESYLSPERELFFSSLSRTLRGVFPRVVILPGPSAVFVATTSTGVPVRTAEEFVARLTERGVHTEFVNAYVLPFRLSEAAFEFLERRVENPQAGLNTDVRPVCFLYDAILWNLHFAGPGRWVISRLARVSGRTLAATLGVLTIGLLIATIRQKRSLTLPALTVLVATGLTGVAMQVVLIFSFQTILGYVYAKIGVLTAAFMVGMSAGAFVLARRESGRTRSPAWMLTTQLLAAGLLLAFVTGNRMAIPHPVVTELAFYVFSLLFGFCGGALFVPANRLLLASQRTAKSLPVGTGYAVDLAGSALGALIVSSLSVPLWGIAFTLLMVIECNVAALLIVLAAGRGGRLRIPSP